MTPAWHDNILACYPALLARLAQVSGVIKVIEIEDFADLDDGKKVVPLDGAVYVVLDGFTPTSIAGQNNHQTIEIGFSVILAKRKYTPTKIHNRAGLGETYTAIARALQGFDPKDAQGRALTITPFVQRAALPIDYRNGYALFPLRFTTTVAVTGNPD